MCIRDRVSTQSTWATCSQEMEDFKRSLLKILDKSWKNITHDETQTLLKVYRQDDLEDILSNQDWELNTQISLVRAKLDAFCAQSSERLTLLIQDLDKDLSNTKVHQMQEQVPIKFTTKNQILKRTMPASSQAKERPDSLFQDTENNTKQDQYPYNLQQDYAKKAINLEKSRNKRGVTEQGETQKSQQQQKLKHLRTEQSQDLEQNKTQLSTPANKLKQKQNASEDKLANKLKLQRIEQNSKMLSHKLQNKSQQSLNRNLIRISKTNNKTTISKNKKV
eukprot:TRINITY_DN35709_c0_g1_i1.p2 TRINITY_DN35709_c0_g1~~TRINITY_DN35709_c0_g1_i1.p2  ORF type:complete len:278 (-),score=31.20 TRINITY_DN35709_c0_g1_i1:457-1290(-)